MDTLVITHLVEKEREGTYYKLPFEVPEGVRSLTIRYSYPGGGNVIDLGLEDEGERFLGWSGSSRSSITVGQYDATAGYCMEPIRPGTWQILIGAYHVRREGVTVRYEISFTPGAPVWLFGDLHVHSDASDGQHSIPTLAEKAKRKGLDFLAVTNHNNYAENFHLPKVPGLTLIPGTEWTHYRGHMNFLGIRQPFSGSFVANTPEQMRGITDQARERGALVSVNHPKCTVCPYLWEDEDCFGLVEVWNGPMRQVNRNGIDWWLGLLRKGRHLTCVGGSDFHRDRSVVRLGNPVTAVLADSPSVEDLLSAIARGRCYVTGSVRGVRLHMTCGEETFGGTVGDGALTHCVDVAAWRLPLGAVLRLVGSDGTLDTLRPRRGRVQKTVEVSGTDFVLLLAGFPLPGGKIWPLAVSNPIYLKA